MPADVQFILGRAGSGKTGRVNDLITRELLARPLGPPVWLIVPAQATFLHQRMLLCRGELRASLRLRVVSPERFAELALEAADCAHRPTVSPIGRELLLTRLLHRHRDRLRFFQHSAHQPGLPALIGELFDELDRAGQTVDDFAEVVRAAAAEGDPALSDEATLLKAQDLLTLGRAYAETLGDHLDPRSRRRLSEACVRSSPVVKGSTIYVDSFFDLAAADRRLLAAAVGVAARVTVTALVDPRADHATLRRPAEAQGLIRRDLASAGCRVLEDERLTAAVRWDDGGPTLRKLEDAWLNGGKAGGGVRMIEAADATAEVEAAARQVADWVRGGRRLRDCVVLCRDLGTYLPTIERVFPEHGLTYFADRRRTAAHHPLSRLVANLLVIARDDWPREAVAGVLKTRLAGLGEADADLLERYAADHRLRGGEAWRRADDWDWRHHRARPGEAAADEADRLRRAFVAAVAPLCDALAGEACSFAGVADALDGVLAALGVEATIRAWADASPPEEAEEHLGVWSSVTSLVGQARELLGTQTAPPAEAASVLLAVLGRVELAIVPPTLDAVLVGSVERVRTPDVEAAVVLGLGDGQFPRTPETSVILGDAERVALRRREIEVAADADRLLADERLLAYHALTRASHALTLTRPLTAGGEVLGPSAYWRELLAITGAAVERPGDDAATLATPRQVVAAVADDAHGRRPGAVAKALRRRLETSDDARLADAWKAAAAAIGYANAPALPAALARELAGEEVGVTELETWAACPFRHFAAHALGLREPEDDDVTSRDRGELAHDVLEACLARLIDEGHDFAGDEPADLAARVAAAVAELAPRVRRSVLMGSARNAYVRRKLAEEAEAALRRELRHFRAGEFRPTRTELSFGDGRDWPGVDLGRARLKGRIDRLDLGPGGAACVVDYKRSGASLTPGLAAHGLQLQLLTYLHAARDQGHAPAAGLYVQLRQTIETVPDPNAHEDQPLAPRPAGVVDAGRVRAFDRAFVSGSSAVVPAQLTKAGEPYRSCQSAVDVDRLGDMLDAAVTLASHAADGVAAGRVAVSPYRLGTRTPCSGCGYRDVCRHEPHVNGYRDLAPPGPPFAREDDDA